MDDLDRILTNEPVVRPTDEFTARVMERVREEAEMPPPIEFPWARFLPGFFTCLGLIFTTFMILGWTGGAGMDLDTQSWIDAANTNLGHAVGLAGTAVLGSLIVAAMAFRSIGRSGASPTI